MCLRKHKKANDLTNTKQTQQKNSDNVDLLLKYKELLDKGVITQEEFDEKKTALLK